MLRCKKGDLAIVLKSATGKEGMIVEVGRYFGRVEVDNFAGSMEQAWQVIHSSHSPRFEYFSEDKDLLPIRPDELNETEETEKELINVE